MPFISGGGSSSLSGVTVGGTAASGQVPVASSSSAATWAYPPGFEIGYDQITAGVNVVSLTEATGTTIITCAAHTFDGGPVIAEFFSPGVNMDTAGANDHVVISLFESTTQIGRFAFLFTVVTTVARQFPASGRFRFTPTAGSHTYTVTAAATSTTGTPAVTAGSLGTAGDAPCYVRFTKV